jgi:hypothetical protein
MILNYLLLPVFFFIGAVTCYEDFKFGKIRNKWIILGAAWSLAVFLFFLAWYFAGPAVMDFYYDEIREIPAGAWRPNLTVHLDFIGRSLLNGILSLLVGFLMWRSRLWAAGDAKLFFAFSMLIPITFYWKSFLPFFPSFSLLINIFIPVTLFLLFRSLLHFFKFARANFSEFSAGSFLKKIKAGAPALKNQGIMVVCFLTVFLALGLLQQKAGFNSNFQVIFFPLLIIFSGPISVFFQKRLVIKISLGLFFSFLLFDLIAPPYGAFELLVQSLKPMAVFMIVFYLFTKAVNFYVSAEEKKGRPSLHMAAWMFLGALITLFAKGSLLSFF